jgi:hypothetical protein
VTFGSTSFFSAFSATRARLVAPAALGVLGLQVAACHRTADAALPAAATRVLFIGNSYTYVNDLPGHLRALGDAKGTRFVTDSVTAGAATLRMHLDNAAALTKILEGHYAYVILQGQSCEPLTGARAFASAARGLSDAVRASGAVPVFYETWARRVGDSVYGSPWSGKSPKAMQAGLRTAYRAAAAEGAARLAPVGDALERAEERDSSLVYYDPDGSHPSPATTFLAAAVLYETLALAPSEGAPGPSDLPQPEARFLEEVAHATVAAPAGAPAP